MADNYTTVTKKGYFSRLGSSIKGILTGLLLFLLSFAVLYWNEGRVDLSNIAEDAVPFTASEQAAAELDGELVAGFGTLSTEEKLGDDMFLKPGAYMQVVRKTQVYAWVEKTSTETETKLGGSEETKTTYSYQKDWVNKAANADTFKVPRGHGNVAKTIEGSSVTVATAALDKYAVEPGALALVGSQELTLTEEMVDITENDEASLEGNEIFVGIGTMSKPFVGDMRVSYSVVPSPQSDVTVLGKLQGEKIAPYFDKDGNKLYRAFKGDKEAAVAKLGKEHSRMTWILRVVGFLMMWIGLAAIFAPLHTMLDVIPLFGSIGKSAIKGVALVIALVLSIVTILISMIAHNMWALIAVVVILVGGFGFLVKKKMAEKNGGAPSPGNPA